MTDRAYGAQSMSAPLLRRPGQATRSGVRGRLRRPGTRLPAPGRPRRRPTRARRIRRGAGVTRAAGPRARRRIGFAGPRLHVRPAAGDRSRRDPAPAGQAESRAGAGRDRILDARGRHPDARPDRAARDDRRGRHVLAASRPAVHRPDAADQRRGRPTSCPTWSVAMCGPSTCRTGAAGSNSSTSCRSSRPSPTTSRSSTCRSCPSGCGSCSEISGSA